MDIVKGIQRSLDVYFKNFVLLFLATLTVAAVFIVPALGMYASPAVGFVLFIAAVIGIGPLFGGLIVLVLKLLRGEKAEFNEIFAHFDKLVPVLLITLMVTAVSLVLWLVAFLIAPIWVLGPPIIFVLNLAVYPATLLLYILALGFAMDRGAAPLDAAKKALGCLLTNPLMVWLYALVIGILAVLGGLIGGLINVGLITALSFLGFFAAILALPVTFALLALTAPVGVIGLLAAYEELSAKEPGRLKLDKQVIQITGIVLACLVVVGVAARIFFHRVSYSAWGVGRLFGVRSGFGDRGPSRVQFGGFDVGEGLPKDFPRDIPIYPGAKVERSLGGSGTDGGGSMTTLTAKDPPDQIYAFYQEKLEAKGWTLEQSTFGLTFTKGSRMVLVMANESDGRTDIVLTVGQEE